MDDVTHIAVSEGPGSFTGIRIGMATAKALAQALSLPTISVPTLESFAFHLPEFDGLVCPILDARREQVYSGVYYRSQGNLLVAVADGAYEIEELLQRIDQFDPDHQRALLFFGDGIPVYKNAVDAWKIRTENISFNGDFSLSYAKEEDRYQKAKSVARSAYRLLQEGKVGEFDQLKPVYLRKAEAERRLIEKLQQVDQT
jgi:tRNA threonylcarbamoyladenosine biosynthesis protein TsaB